MSRPCLCAILLSTTTSVSTFSSSFLRGFRSERRGRGRGANSSGRTKRSPPGGLRVSAPRVLREQTRKQSHPQTQRRSSLRRNRLFQTNVHGGTADPETLRVRARTEAEPDRQTRPANRDAMEAIAVPLRGALPRLKARTGDRWGLAFQPRRHQAQGPPAQDLGASAEQPPARRR